MALRRFVILTDSQGNIIKSAIPDAFRPDPNAGSSDSPRGVRDDHRTVVERPEFRGDIRYGDLKLSSRFHLSPLAGFTTLPFRRIVRNIGGVGLATTDLVNCRALLSQNSRTMQMIETHEEDQPFAVQIFGSEPRYMAEAAQFLEARGVATIDINMGCPVKRIAGAGSGAGMMCNTTGTISLVRQVVESVKIPVSVKMRLGWDDDNLTAPFFAKEFEQVGVCAIAIHGRTREQGFSGSVSRPGIRRVVEAVDRIPVVGNGDVRSVADAAQMIRETNCHAVSIGRAALANPWIFRQLDEWERTGSYSPAGTFEERLALMVQQYEFVEQQHPPERAIILFRKMAHWYLKGMRIRKKLRGDFQFVKTREEFNATLEKIRNEGPVGGNRSGILSDCHIPTPSGPVSNW